MYMGVIPEHVIRHQRLHGAPHVYGGDPYRGIKATLVGLCSPCIWG